MFNLGSGITDPSLIFTTTNLFLGAIKLMLLVGGVLYFIFSILIVRQVQLMRTTIMTSLSLPLILIGIVHAGLALVALLYYLSV